MVKLNPWSDLEAAKTELAKRLADAKQRRSVFESIWDVCLREVYLSEATSDIPTIFREKGWLNPAPAGGVYVRPSFGADEGLDEETVDSDLYANYIQKNVRYRLSQLSNNPPSVVPRPTSPDPKDRKAAEAANQLIKYGQRQYKMQDVKDLAALNAIIFGSGWIKTIWNPQLGDVISYDPQTQEVLMSGDIEICSPSIFDVYPDPAKNWEKCRYVFERIQFSREMAEYYFGEYLEKVSIPKDQDMVDIYQYWEKGLPVNGMMGRFCWCLEDGTVLGDKIVPNPFGPVKTLSDGKKFRRGQLPYLLMTEMDVPDTYWGVPVILFSVMLQREVNLLDRLTFSNIKANGSSHVITSDDNELLDESISNNPVDVWKYRAGTPPPQVMTPSPVSPTIPSLRSLYVQAIQDVDGINEAQFGVQSRETSAVSMQFATQQGMSLNQRTFTKFVSFIEGLYKNYLELVQEHFETGRKLTIEGSERAFDIIEFDRADIAGGYAFVSEFGTDFSLDPIQRRQELMNLVPFFEKAGVDPKVLLAKLKLNDLSNLFADIEMAQRRQSEIFDRMILDPEAKYIPPEELQNHKEMLNWAYQYVMTAEFDRISNIAVKDNIRKHIKEREELEAKTRQTAAPVASAAPPSPLEAAATQPPSTIGAALQG